MFQLLAFPIDLSDSKLGVAAHTHYPNIDFLAENAHKNIFQVVWLFEFEEVCLLNARIAFSSWLRYWLGHSETECFSNLTHDLFPEVCNILAHRFVDAADVFDYSVDHFSFISLESFIYLRTSLQQGLYFIWRSFLFSAHILPGFFREKFGSFRIECFCYVAELCFFCLNQRLKWLDVILSSFAVLQGQILQSFCGLDQLFRLLTTVNIERGSVYFT